MAEMEPEITGSGDETPTVEMHETTPIQPNRPRKVYAGMWGPLEIIAVGVGAFALLIALVVYAFLVIPSNRELARNKSEADRLDAERQSANSKYGEITTTEAQVAKLVTSVDDFETRFLPLQANGQTALYQRLNGLILSYGLTNTSGPDYAPLETADQNNNQQADDERGRAKYRSLYPGVYVSTTVEGSYQDIRRFIRDVETGNEFIIISAVELAPSDNQKQTDQTKPTQPANPNLAGANQTTKGNPRLAPNTGNPGGGFNQTLTQPLRPKGKTHGDVVSLHIEMAAYFRRPNYVPTAARQ